MFNFLFCCMYFAFVQSSFDLECAIHESKPRMPLPFFQPSSHHILGNIRGDAKKERRSDRADLKEMKVVYFLKICFVADGS